MSTAPELAMDALTSPLEGSPATLPAQADGPKKGRRQGRKREPEVALTKEEDDEEVLHPLPDNATGFRKRSPKEGHVPVRSSSIPGMTVGQVRKSLNQIRKAGTAVKSDHILWNGWTAGRFALAYLLGNHSKRQKVSAEDGEPDDEEHAEEGATQDAEA